MDIVYRPCNDSLWSLVYPSYLFSLALCLKSSMAFMNRVTLNSPLSLSSNSRLEDKTGICDTAVMYWWSIKRHPTNTCRQWHHLLRGSRHHHFSQCFICFLPISISCPERTKDEHLWYLSDELCWYMIRNEQYSLWYHNQKSDKVLWIKYKVFFLDNVSQAPGQQAPPGGKRQCYKNMGMTPVI